MTEFWGAIIAAATFATIVIGAVWAVMQAQLRSITAAREIKEKCFEDDIKYVRERIESLEFTRINALEGRFIFRDTFNEFKQGHQEIVAVLRSQLSILETTRPTTGELSAAAADLRHALDKLEARLTTLEQRFNIPVGKTRE